MFRKTLAALFAIALTALTIPVDDAIAADRNAPGPRATARRGLPAGLPHAHYATGRPSSPARRCPMTRGPMPTAAIRWAPYTNSYGIPAAVIVDPVDPAVLWRPLPYDDVYATPYSCFYYGSC